MNSRSPLEIEVVAAEIKKIENIRTQFEYQLCTNYVCTNIGKWEVISITNERAGAWEQKG